MSSERKFLVELDECDMFLLGASKKLFCCCNTRWTDGKKRMRDAPVATRVYEYALRGCVCVSRVAAQ